MTDSQKILSEKPTQNSLAIVGAGVAGLTCAIYARRANCEVTVFEQLAAGGLTATIDNIENFPGYTSINGFDLADGIFRQAKSLGVQFKYQQVLSIEHNDGNFTLSTNSNTYTYNSVVVATGTKHNKLGIEDKYIGRGVSYCATCDGGFFKDKPVAVAGSANSAVKEAMYLSGVCSKVYVLCPKHELTAEQQLLESLNQQQNVEILFNKTVTNLLGEQKLEKITFADNISNKQENLDISALFVAVGSAPATDFLNNLELERKNGFLAVNDRMMTSLEGLFAAGDVSNGNLKQIVTACADGAKAGNFAAAYLKIKSRQTK